MSCTTAAAAMPKTGQRLSDIRRIEDASALAATARQRLAQIAAMLDSVHRRGGLSDYNHDTASQDIADVTAVIWHLQNTLCQFRGGNHE